MFLIKSNVWLTPTRPKQVPCHRSKFADNCSICLKCQRYLSSSCASNYECNHLVRRTTHPVSGQPLSLLENTYPWNSFNRRKNSLFKQSILIKFIPALIQFDFLVNIEEISKGRVASVCFVFTC
ncbi:hypothetical protein CDAR_461531 [Caerostris darwini]|uniref:Uncharacterized protein n=1 Tax=Caerostris darwini TaxID=1538125 RepID=A0AAV4M5Y6_9ARAC|nr:hypothetical protein CDAR_461531 [Caerostris darwini]